MKCHIDLYTVHRSTPEKCVYHKSKFNMELYLFHGICGLTDPDPAPQRDEGEKMCQGLAGCILAPNGCQG